MTIENAPYTMFSGYIYFVLPTTGSTRELCFTDLDFEFSYSYKS